MKRNGWTDNFATWIRDRIAQYDFVENQDFVTFSENSEKGRPRLDMAKELSMVERICSWTPFIFRKQTRLY